ncbi:putative bacteriophage protein [Shigella flexneri 5 str. 8401]|uniref:Putative bacteriophage protein n=1 Tax=Shigella flexneri serotype 5b (strain 8401) TaxID=373384 RepID=Q0T7T7_SHIF8|nr:putative bacteriophage protein [Shigella flexneri 5 str. 8401]
MKQMSLIEMDGFLKGKCIPRDLKVNETNTEYLVRKFGELESKLETALRECRSAGITIDNLEAKCAKMAAENTSLKQSEKEFNDFCREEFSEWEDDVTETPATDAFLAEIETRRNPQVH